MELFLVPLISGPLTLLGEDGTAVWSRMPGGPPVRRAEDRRDAGTLRLQGGVVVPLVTVELGAVTGLPDPAEGIGYVVSRITAEAAAGRDDVFCPDGQVIGPDGRIIGCRALARVKVA
jgi:hypothetical protein